MLATYPIRENEGVKILDLPKRLTGLQNGEELEMVLEDLLSEGVKNVVLDFSLVSYIDTFVLGSLIREHLRYASRRSRLKILNPAGKIRNVLAVTRLVSVFECFEDEATAVGGLW